MRYPVAGQIMRGKQFNMVWSEAFFKLNARVIKSSMFAPLLGNIIKLVDTVLLYFFVVANSSELINGDQTKQPRFLSSLVLRVR